MVSWHRGRALEEVGWVMGRGSLRVMSLRITEGERKAFLVKVTFLVESQKLEHIMAH